MRAQTIGQQKLWEYRQEGNSFQASDLRSFFKELDKQDNDTFG